MLKLRMKSVFASILFVLTSAQGQASLESNIFSFGDEQNLANMNVKLSGETKTGLQWTARPVTEADTAFIADFYMNPTTMMYFADGLQTKEEAVKRAQTRINIWQTRFKQGMPHGGLVVLDADMKAIAHFVNGGGDEPGASEVARMILPDYAGQGMGTSLMQTVVKIWSPEVARLGRDQSNEKVAKKFQCFGGEALKRLDATASPSNVSSWKSQDYAGFTAAKSKVQGEGYAVSFDGKEYEGVLKRDLYAAMEKDILTLFDANHTPQPLVPGTRYSMVDIDGKVRTFSRHLKYDGIKYHAEYMVE